jgi:glycosyltransferase involved in cell wall biosynthesis
MATSPEPGRGVEHRFVVPDLAGPSTGGTVYNRELVRALVARGAALDVLEPPAAERALRAGEAGTYWIDTLFLARVPELARRAGAGQRLGLIAHYLPGLVRYGAEVTRAELSPGETAALDAVDVFLAPSDFMRDTLLRLGAATRPIAVVEPGRLAAGVRAPLAPSGVLRAIVVAHLVVGKGVDRLLSALATSVAADDPLTLEVVGSTSADAAYAEGCRVFATAPSLRERVTLTGELRPNEVNERIAASNLLLSASSMESFGMAIAEARTLGVPVVARSGGNVERLIDAASGGELVADAASVAARCVALSQNPSELAARCEQATKHALAPRPWHVAATEFLERAS